MNDIGLNANFNMKRERLNTSEVSLNIDVLLPYVDNMLAERKLAINALNEMYGMEITVDLASTWQITHNELEHDIPGDDQDTEIEVTVETDEPEDPVEAEETYETDETGEPEDPDATVETDEPDPTDGTDEPTKLKEDEV